MSVLKTCRLRIPFVGNLGEKKFCFSTGTMSKTIILFVKLDQCVFV